MIFVDTGAWFALAVESDPNHERALTWLKKNPGRLVTTEHVVSETLTLLLRRREHTRARILGRRFNAEHDLEILWTSRKEFRRAWHVFESYTDKGWSVADCISYVAIETHAIETAFSFDRHFRQFGNVSVGPANE